MGRIKTQLTKRTAIKLVNDNPNTFKPTFEENKAVIGDVADIRSVKLRNTIAGYITRLIRSKR
ncbi:30S ribosomal protein S17e [Candidatus Woesearchaeota archaeon]|nr:30S ribosomal protein S17e [Candidatus Woesearchaeota archaeon]